MDALSVILLAEEREDDAVLLRRALRRAKVPSPRRIANNGEKAIAYLQPSGYDADREEVRFRP